MSHEQGGKLGLSWEEKPQPLGQTVWEMAGLGLVALSSSSTWHGQEVRQKGRCPGFPPEGAPKTDMTDMH
jgi:hypothetical protein